jgi:hypothetical protein
MTAVGSSPFADTSWQLDSGAAPKFNETRISFSIDTLLDQFDACSVQSEIAFKDAATDIRLHPDKLARRLKGYVTELAKEFKDYEKIKYPSGDVDQLRAAAYNRLAAIYSTLDKLRDPKGHRGFTSNDLSKIRSGINELAPANRRAPKVGHMTFGCPATQLTAQPKTPSATGTTNAESDKRSGNGIRGFVITIVAKARENVHAANIAVEKVYETAKILTRKPAGTTTDRKRHRVATHNSTDHKVAVHDGAGAKVRNNMIAKGAGPTGSAVARGKDGAVNPHHNVNVTGQLAAKVTKPDGKPQNHAFLEQIVPGL